MPSRRPADDDDPRPRRSGKGPPPRSGAPVLLFALLGLGVVAGLVVGIVLVVVRPKADPTPAAGATTVAQTTTPAPTRPRPLGPEAAPPAAGELVVNGSFEDGPEPDPAGIGQTLLVTGSTVVRGWTVTRGSVDYIGHGWEHADGRRSIDLNGNTPGAISQTIRTTPGKRYRLTFQLAGNNCGVGGGVKTLIVRVGDGRTDFSFDASRRSYEDMGWEEQMLDFTARDAETELEFISTTNRSLSCGPALDRVSVVEIGE